MRKDKWYETNWFALLLVAVSIVVGIVSNYLTHGGHISW